MRSFLLALAALGGGLSMAARNRLGGASSGQEIESIVSLLEQNGYDSQVLKSVMEQDQDQNGKVTPWVKHDQENVLFWVRRLLESNVMDPIKAAFAFTQGNLASAIEKVRSHTAEAQSKFATAESFDRIWFDCVEVEKIRLSEVEGAEAAIDEAKQNASVPCQDEMTRRLTPFTFTVSPGAFTCDLSVGECEEKFKDFMTQIQGKLQTEQDGYNEAKAACDEAQAAIVRRTNDHANALEMFRDQKDSCLELKGERHLSMCSFGDELNIKCEAAQEFRELSENVMTEDGNVYSEPDRQTEWKTVSVISCLILDVYNGLSLDNSSVAQCEASVNYEEQVGRIDMLESTYMELTSPGNFTCDETSFAFTGQDWTTGNTSDDYTVVGFVPEYPFAFCALPAPREQTCNDFEGWVDSWNDGCSWYAWSSRRCTRYGFRWPGEGSVSAALACCVCGGGVRSLAAPTPAPPPGSWSVSSGTGCEIVGSCIQSSNHPSNYGNNEQCSVQLTGVALNTETFSTERNYDILSLGGSSYSGTSGPPSGLYTGTMSWASDYSITASGWSLCRTN